MAGSTIPDSSLSRGSEAVYDTECHPCSSEGKHSEAENEMENKMKRMAMLQEACVDPGENGVEDCTFKPNDEVETIIKGEDGFGKVVVKKPDERKAQPPDRKLQHTASKSSEAEAAMQQIKATHIADINGNTSNDKTKCFISGMALVSTDTVVIADCNNDTVKLLNATNKKVVSEHKPVTFACDVTVIGDRIAATLPRANKIIFLKYTDGLVHDRDIAVNGHCRGIDSADGKLFVVYKEECRLEILTPVGVVLQRLETNGQGGRLFEKPEFISINITNQCIYVTEWGKGILKIISMGGKQTSLFEDIDMLYPRQVAVDKASGRMFICNSIKHRVHVLSAQNKKVQILLDQNDGLMRPVSACYCDTTQRLFVGMFESDIIKVFRIS